MRMVVLVLAGWAGSLTVALGLFVALVRGGGGTDLAPLPAAVTPVPVDLPQPRAAAEDQVRAQA